MSRYPGVITPERTLLADVAQEAYSEVANRDADPWLEVERRHLLETNPVLVTYLDQAFSTIIQRPDSSGGPEVAQAMRQGYLYAYRVVGKFAERAGQEIPRVDSTDRADEALWSNVPRHLLADPYCHAAATEAGFADYPDFLDTFRTLRYHTAQEGAGIIFIIFRDFLLQLHTPPVTR